MKTNWAWWLIPASLACSLSVSHAEGGFKNGLSIRSFGKNALLNDAAMRALRGSKLNQSLIDTDVISTALEDPAARAVMTEIVRCALNAGPQVTWTDPRNATSTVTFYGQLGLCQNAAHPGGDWTADLPSQTCREIVTGCVAAAVNAKGRSIPISVLGGASVPGPNPSVTGTTTYRYPVTGDPAEGQTIASFTSGWQPALEGTCTTPRANVTIKASTCNVPIRVCSGVEGCLGSGVTPPMGSETTSSFVGESASACTGMTFQCPDSKMFSAMAKTAGAVPTISISSGAAVYPAPEAAIYAVREGAFYGDMFDGHLRVTCTWSGTGNVCMDAFGCSGTCLPDRVPFTNVFGCFAMDVANNQINNGALYLNDRMCGAGRADCFNETPKICHYVTAQQNHDLGSHCTLDQTTGIYGTCKDPLTPDGYAFHAITTYLNKPCDVIDSGTCSALGFIKKLSRDDLDEPAPDVIAVDIDDDGGCSIGRSRGGVVTLVLAMMAIAFAARRRSRR